MAQPKKKTTRQTTRVVKKKWYEIITSGYFDNLKLGETLLDDPQKLLGKPIHVNVMTLTNNVRQQQITLEYRVERLEGDKGIASWKGLELSPTYIKRLIRRRTTRIDASFIIKTDDGTLVRVKPLVVTRNTVSADVRGSIRRALTETIVERFSKMRHDELLDAVLSVRIQRELKKSLSSYTPIKIVEFRALETVQGGTVLTPETFQGSRKKATKQITKTVKRTRRKARAAKQAETTEESSEQASEQS